MTTIQLPLIPPPSFGGGLVGVERGSAGCLFLTALPRPKLMRRECKRRLKTAQPRSARSALAPRRSLLQPSANGLFYHGFSQIDSRLDLAAPQYVSRGGGD